MRRALVLLLLASFAFAATPPAEYRERRQALREKIRDGVLVLFGATDATGRHRSAFFQESNFYYLTGWREPGAILALTPETEILFLPRRNPDQERWTGPRTDPLAPGAAARTGFDVVRPAESFEAALPEILEDGAKVYTLLQADYADKLKALLPLRRFADAAPMIGRLRAKKSPSEIGLLRRAVEVTVDAHRAAWRRLAPGLFEYQLAAAMAAVYLDAGCGRPAYAPIVGSGPNALVLHYSENSRRMDAGELVLMDVGAECGRYAADLTRTVPVSGRFSKRQRELYEIVLGAQRAAIAAVKPGMTLAREGPNSLYRVACDYFDQYRDANGEGLCQYFTHNIGHHIGLDVHDPVPRTTPLEPGMVITIEPGLYIPEENIGIRIEDMVLVTEDGGEVLSDSLPKEPDAVTALIGG